MPRTKTKQTGVIEINRDALYDYAALASLLGVTRRCIQQAKARGDLRAYIFGQRILFAGSDVREWLHSTPVEPPRANGLG